MSTIKFIGVEVHLAIPQPDPITLKYRKTRPALIRSLSAPSRPVSKDRHRASTLVKGSGLLRFRHQL